MNAAPGTTSTADPNGHKLGLTYAISAYLLWGAFPLYFIALIPAGPLEVVAWRVIFSLAFCIILILITRTWATLRTIAQQPRLLILLGTAGALVVINWLVYVYATLNGQVVAASLGYFINPIITVLLGVLILRERLRPAQWVAVAICGGAVLILAIGYGEFPWISLTLALSFGLYGFVKKWVGPRVDAVSGLTLETALLAPVAIGLLLIVAATDGIVLGTAGPLNTALLICTGIVTAIPLLLFAAASRRLPLIWIGLTQFLTPVLQFALGAFVLGEPMPLERWTGFFLVWIALIVLTTDMIATGRAARRASPLPG